MRQPYAILPLQGGFSLVEVMIAMLVMALGAAGLGVLLLASVQGTVQAGERSQAVLQGSELAQLIYANPAVWGHYTHGIETGEDCESTLPCSSDSWAVEQLQQWQQELQDSIAMANGTVCRDSSPQDGDLLDLACDEAGPAVVKVVWQEAAGPGQQPGLRRLVLPLPQ